MGSEILAKAAKHAYFFPNALMKMADFLKYVHTVYNSPFSLLKKIKITYKKY